MPCSYLDSWIDIYQVIGFPIDSMSSNYDTEIHLAWSTDSSINMQIKWATKPSVCNQKFVSGPVKKHLPSC